MKRVNILQGFNYENRERKRFRRLKFHTQGSGKMIAEVIQEKG